MIEIFLAIFLLIAMVVIGVVIFIALIPWLPLVIVAVLVIWYLDHSTSKHSDKQ